MEQGRGKEQGRGVGRKEETERDGWRERGSEGRNVGSI